MSLLKAFIVEDSAVIRDNLVAALEEMVPLKVVGTAEDEAGALSWLADPGHCLRHCHRRHLSAPRHRTERVARAAARHADRPTAWY